MKMIKNEAIQFAHSFIKSLGIYQNSNILLCSNFLYIVDSLYIMRLEIPDVFYEDAVLISGDITLEAPHLFSVGDVTIKKQDLKDFLTNINYICEKHANTLLFVDKNIIVNALNSEYKTPGRLSKLVLDVMIDYSHLEIKCLPIKKKTPIRPCSIDIGKKYKVLRLGDNLSARANTLVFLRICEVLNTGSIIKLEMLENGTLKIRSIKNKSSICWVVNTDNMPKKILNNFLCTRNVGKKCLNDNVK